MFTFLVFASRVAHENDCELGFMTQKAESKCQIYFFHFTCPTANTFEFLVRMVCFIGGKDYRPQMLKNLANSVVLFAFNIE